MDGDKAASGTGTFRFAIGLLVLSALLGILILLLTHGGGFSGAATAAVTPQPASAPAANSTKLPAADGALAAMVAQELATLPVKPKTVIVPSDQSLEEIAAIKRGDYESARRIAESVLARSNLKGWGFYPWNQFMNTMTRGNDPVLLDHLNEWVRREPQSALAYLVRAWYYHETAWTVRAEGVGWKIPPQLYREFRDDLRQAATDAGESIRLNPQIPWSYYLVLLIATGEGNTADAEPAFRSGIKAFPEYYELYRQRLYSLTPKWGGSVGDMYAFVERYAGRAPEDSRLKLLYLQVYAYLLDAAGFDCNSLQNERRQECASAEMRRLGIPPAVGDGVVKALKLYKVSDPISFSNAVWPVLSDMASTPGSGSDSSAFGATLQVAASIMGSDNQLSDEPGHNSYVLDDVTAQVWVAMGNNNNAEQKFREALGDIEHAPFPSEELRAEAMATVYDHMTEFARRTSQFMSTIVYYDAANTVGGINHGSAQHLKCWAYNHLKHFSEGVTECTRVLQQSYGNTLLTHYSLARAYEGLEQWDAALAEFAPVADSADNYLRVGAATEMSLIYGSKKNDPAAELASLNQHPYLFDARMQPPDDLAVSFNNRCYAYMQLGELEKALNDCTTSLKYDHIPDAFHKQQELMRRLAVRAKTL